MKKNVIAILLLSLTACGQATKKQPVNSNETATTQNTHTDWQYFDNASYAVQYPKEWTIDKSGTMGTTFMLFSPMESQEDKFRENVNLMIQDLGGQQVDLDQFASLSEAQIKSLITNSALVSHDKLTKGSESYYRLIYTGDQGVFHLKFEQYYWLHKGKAYIMTFTAEQSKFDAFKDAGEGILNSFEIKG